MVKKTWLAFGVIAVIGFILAACSPQRSPAVTSEIMEPAKATASMPALELEPTNTSGAIETPADGNASGVDPVTTVDDPTMQVTATTAPRVKDELEATDPRSVVLASGDLQFVEFFAFW